MTSHAQRALAPVALVLGAGARIALHVALPLGIGVLAYAAGRSSDVPVVAWLLRVAPRAALALRSAAAPWLVHVPSRLAGSLPDLAWAWAFGAALALVWRGRAWREKAAWLGAGAAAALATELGQRVHLVPGTYDPLDLASIAAGYALGVVLAGRGPAARSQRSRKTSATHASAEPGPFADS